MNTYPKLFAIGFGGGGSGSGMLSGAQWTQIGPAPLRETFAQGPAPVAGRLYDLAIDPSGQTDNVIYLATLGGIWKSTDGGTSWAPKTDRLPWNQMSAVAIDPGNPSTIYAGAFWSPGPSFFKSIDGGETWSITGGAAMEGPFMVTRIVVPSPGVILVATFGQGGQGLFRSIDGGMSFGNNFSLYNNNAPILPGSIWDLHLDTSTPSIVYACVGGVGIFVSTDGGATFPTNLFTNPGAPAAGTFGYVSMTQSTKPDSKTFYASVATAGWGYLGLYKSTNGGSKWTQQPGATPVAAQSGQFGFNQTVGVDPQDPKRVYLGFEELWLSTDGATSFGVMPVTLTQVHSDHHAIGFSPKSHWSPPPTRLYVGTDGGFAVSIDGGKNWTNLNEGVATILVEEMDIGRGSAANNVYSYAGSQDNGISGHLLNLPGPDWRLLKGGDGWLLAVDPSSPLRVYGALHGSNVFLYLRTSDGGTNWSWGAAGLPAFIGKLVVDPNDGTVIYAGAGPVPWGKQLMQSTDSGGSFSTIHTFPASITSITIVPFDSNTVWVGLGDGSVWRTSNALAGAASIWTSFPGLPVGREATSIAVDPLNSFRVAVAYAGITGIQPPNRTQHVYLTEDGGTKWVDASGTDGGLLSNNLPDRSVFAVAIDPGSTNGLFGVTWSGNLIVAVGLHGIILTSPDGKNWTAQASYAHDTLASVTWTGSQFVAVGLHGSILTSPDGATWTTRKFGPSWEALQGIAWSGSRLVATSASEPAIYTSPDGVTWTKAGGIAPQALLDIKWSGTMFVAVGYGGIIITSPDGVTWTTRAAPTADDLVCISWSGSQFIVGGLHGTILSSPDGITWMARASPTTNEINGLAWSGTRFVGVVDTGEVVTSPDGATWAIQPSSTSNRLLDVASAGNSFVAVGDEGTILTSTSGFAWTDHSYGTVPFALIVGIDAGVMSSVNSGATWQVLGVGLPIAICVALALDWTRSPALLRVGMIGRSVFELTATPGRRVMVESNLAFGHVAVGSPAKLVARVFNVGSAPLTINGFPRTSGGLAFQLLGGVQFPQIVSPGTEVDFTLQFQPNALGDATAVFQLKSNDPVNPTVAVPLSGTGV